MPFEKREEVQIKSCKHLFFSVCDDCERKERLAKGQFFKNVEKNKKE